MDPKILEQVGYQTWDINNTLQLLSAFFSKEL
jgi:uncharacterized protein Smg (DUF494 family)